MKILTRKYTNTHKGIEKLCMRSRGLRFESIIQAQFVIKLSEKSLQKLSLEVSLFVGRGVGRGGCKSFKTSDPKDL